MVLRLIILLFFIVSSNGRYSREDTHSPSQGLSYRISNGTSNETLNGTSNETLNGTSNGHSQGQLQLHSIEHSQEYSSNKSANYSRKSPQQVHLSFGSNELALLNIYYYIFFCS